VGDREEQVYLGDSRTTPVQGKGKVLLKLTFGEIEWGGIFRDHNNAHFLGGFASNVGIHKSNLICRTYGSHPCDRNCF